MTASIIHRVTGVALSVGLLVVVWWLVAAATGPEAYAQFVEYASSDFGQWLLFGWLLATYIHLASGIRHLVMDTGKWLSIKGTDAAIIVLNLLAVAATAVTWAYLKGWI